MGQLHATMWIMFMFIGLYLITPIKFCAKKIQEIYYEDSTHEILLQFADFFAFAINRIQTNFSKSQSKFDKAFMEIVGGIRYCNSEDILSLTYDQFHNMSKDDYSNYLEKVAERKYRDKDAVKQLVAYTNNIYEKVKGLQNEQL